MAVVTVVAFLLGVLVGGAGVEVGVLLGARSRRLNSDLAHMTGDARLRSVWDDLVGSCDSTTMLRNASIGQRLIDLCSESPWFLDTLGEYDADLATDIDEAIS